MTLAPVVTLSLGERFVNWFPRHTKLYIRGERTADQETSFGMYLEVATQFNKWIAPILKKRDALTRAQARKDERRIIVAYVRDRLHKYSPDACCRVALEDIAALVFAGEHLEAHRHGELDDLLANPMRITEPSTSEDSRAQARRELLEELASRADGHAEQILSHIDSMPRDGDDERHGAVRFWRAQAEEFRARAAKETTS